MSWCRVLAALGGLAALGALAAAAWWAWPAFGDPLAHLPVPAGPLRAGEEAVERTQGRVVRRLALDAGPLGRVRLAVSLPDPMPRERLPVLFVMGGLRTGENAIRHVERPGANALVAFGYPIDRGAGRGFGLALNAARLRAQTFATPGIAAAALQWTRAQPWADPGRVTPVGVSLGAIFLPAVLALDRKAGARPGPAVLAYGGAGAGMLVGHWLEGAPYLGIAAPILGPFLGLGLAPLDPAAHLPRLGGEFLVLSGSADDALVPAAAARLLAELAPAPKTVERLPGGHVGGETEATRRLVEALRAWLAAKGAIEP
jgi:hypothetical protein